MLRTMTLYVFRMNITYLLSMGVLDRYDARRWYLFEIGEPPGSSWSCYSQWWSSVATDVSSSHVHPMFAHPFINSGPVMRFVSQQDSKEDLFTSRIAIEPYLVLDRRKQRGFY